MGAGGTLSHAETPDREFIAELERIQLGLGRTHITTPYKNADKAQESDNQSGAQV